MADNDYPLAPVDSEPYDRDLLERASKVGIKINRESFQTRRGYREHTPEDDTVDWADYGRQIVGGAAGVAAAVPAIAEISTNGAVGGETRRALQEFSEEQTAALSPQARRNAGASFVPGEGEQSVWDSPLSSMGLKTASSLSSVVAAIIPASIAASVAARIGASAATRIAVAGGAARGANSALNAGEVANQIASEIEKQPDDELQRLSPTYAGYRSVMSEREARGLFMADVGSASMIAAGVIGAMTPGVENMVGRRLGGEAARGVLQGAKSGAAREIPGEVIEGVAGEGLSQVALNDAGITPMNWRKILNAGIEGGAVGGIMGGALGGASNIRGRENPPVTSEVSEPGVTQVTGVAPDEALAIETATAAPAPEPVEPAPASDPLRAQDDEILQAWNEWEDAEPATPYSQRRSAAVTDPYTREPDVQFDDQIDPSMDEPDEDAPVSPQIADIVNRSREPTAPEAPESLEEQIRDMKEGIRPAVLIPKDAVNAPGLPAGFDTVVVPGVGTFYYESELIDAATIRRLANAGRLNEIFNMGETSKLDVVRDVSRGAKEAAVVVRRPDGTPVVEAASSTATAPRDAAVMAEKARPGDTVEITPAAQVLAERAMRNAAAQPPVQAPVQAPVQQTEQTSEELPEDKKHWTKEEKASRSKQDEFGRNAPKLFQPADDELSQVQGDLTRGTKERTRWIESASQLAALAKRMEKVLAEAKKAGINIDDKTKGNPLGIQKTIKANTPDGILYLRVAKDIVRLARTRRLTPEIANKFITEEISAAKGDFTPMRTRRIEEGDQKMRRQQGDVEQVAQNAPAAEQAPVDSDIEPDVVPQNTDALEEQIMGLAPAQRAPAALEFKRQSKEIADGVRGEYDTAAIERAGNFAIKKATPITGRVLQAATEPGKQKGNGRLSEPVKKVKKTVEQRAAEKAAKEQAKAERAAARAAAKAAKLAAANPSQDQIEAERKQRLERNAAEVERLNKSLNGVTPEAVEAEAAKLREQYKAGGIDVSEERIKKAATANVTQRVSKLTEKRPEPNALTEETRTAAPVASPNQAPKTPAERKARIKKLSARLDALQRRATTFAKQGLGKDQKTDDEIKRISAIIEADQRAIKKEGVGDSARLFSVRKDADELEQVSLEVDPNPRGIIQTLSAKDMFDFAQKKLDTWKNLFPFMQDGSEKKDRLKLDRINFAMFRRRLLDAAGDVPVHVVASNSSILYVQHLNVHADGVYDPNTDAVYISERTLQNPEPGYMGRLVIHELAHAAYHRIISTNQNVRAHLQGLLEATRAEFMRRDEEADLPYGLTNIDEFISEAMSDPSFQQMLASMELAPEARLIYTSQFGPVARSIRTYWNMFVDILRSALGLGENQYTMLDATMQIVQKMDSVITESGRPTHRQSVYDSYSKTVARPLLPKVALPNISAEEMRGKLNDRGKSVLSRLGEWAIKGRTLDQLRQSFAGVFTDSQGDPLQKLVEIVQRMAPYAKSKREQGEQLASAFAEYARNNPQDAAEMADLATSATMANVRLGPNADNSHLKGWRGVQGNRQLPNLQARYDAMPAEARDLYREMTAFYRSMQNQMMTGIMRNTLREANPNLSASEVDGLITKAVDGKLVPADEQLIGSDIAVKALKEAAELGRIKGDYFPLMRHGDYVVTWRNDLNGIDLMGGKEIEPGKIEFRANTDAAARALATAFIGDMPFHATALQRSPDTSTSSDYGYIVTAQLGGMRMFDTRVEAERWLRTEGAGLPSVSQVMPRRDTGIASGDLSTAQFNSLLAAVRKNTDPAYVDAMERIIEQAAVRLMAGNRVQKQSLARRNVEGASQDFARNTAVYSQAASGYLAKIEFMPELREAMKRIYDIRDSVHDKSGALRTSLANELDARITNNVTSPSEPSKFIGDLMTLSYLDKLFSPMYSVINGLQVAMVTAPYLGARYGNVRAANEIQRAYRDIGALPAISGGLGNTVKSARQWVQSSLMDMNDVLGSIRRSLANKQYGKEILEGLREAQERGAIDDAGFELAASIAQGRGMWGTNLSRADRVSRQLPLAMEIINRTVTYAATYRLAREAGKSDAVARAEAFDVVMNTQGDYSAANAPRFFSNPYLRPALQFKKYAQMMTFLLARSVYQTFGADVRPEDRKAAIKHLTNVLAMQIIAAGTLSLPGIEIAKVSFMVAAALGLSGGWDDQEEKLRKLAEDSFGKSWGEMVSRGIVSRAIGVDISQRVSLADMWTFGEPRRYTDEGITAYFARLAAGAPGGYALDVFTGTRMALEGEYGKAIERMLPIKVVADGIKAANGYSEGKVTTGEIVANTMGLRTARQAEESRKTGQAVKTRQKVEENYKRLGTKYVSARTKGELARLRVEIAEHNKVAPLRYRVFPNALDKVRERKDKERVN